MKINVNKLTLPQLNWAVAKCENNLGDIEGVFDGVLYLYDDKEHQSDYPVNYTGDWEQGGRIIEQEEIEVSCDMSHQWRARPWGYGYAINNPHLIQSGDTFLIAGMKCYVVSQLGKEIEIPEELV